MLFVTFTCPGHFTECICIAIYVMHTIHVHTCSIVCDLTVYSVY